MKIEILNRNWTSEMSKRAKSPFAISWPYLASQARTRDGIRTPETALLAAILDDALDCAIGNIGNNQVNSCWHGNQRARLRKEALVWITSNDTHPFSFLWICDWLRHDPTRIRARVTSGEHYTATRTTAGFRKMANKSL